MSAETFSETLPIEVVVGSPACTLIYMNNTQSVQIAAITPEAVGPAAARISVANPGMYVFVTVDFDMVTAHLSSKLHVNAPSDAWGTTYWLNGTYKPFTAKQRAADSAATTVLR